MRWLAILSNVRCHIAQCALACKSLDSTAELQVSVNMDIDMATIWNMGWSYRNAIVAIAAVRHC